MTAFRVNDIANCSISTKRLRSFYNQFITFQPCRLPEQSRLKSSSQPPQNVQLRYAASHPTRQAILIFFPGRRLWQMHCRRISERLQGHVCERVHEIEELLFGKYLVPF